MGPLRSQMFHPLGRCHNGPSRKRARGFCAKGWSPLIAAAQRAIIGHLRGDSNLAADAVSRGLWAAFHRLCRQLRIRPQQLSVPRECHDILDQVLDLACERNIPVRPNPYRSAPTAVPPSYMRFLPRQESHSEEALASRKRPLPQSQPRSLTPTEAHRGTRRSNEDGDGPPTSATLSCEQAEKFLNLYNTCEQFDWSTPSNDYYIRDWAVCSQLRALMDCLGCRQAKTATLRAIASVLAQASDPTRFDSDEAAYTAYGASRSNFKHYRRKLTAMLDAATKTFAIQIELDGRGRCPSSTDYDGPGPEQPPPKRSRFYQSNHPSSVSAPTGSRPQASVPSRKPSRFFLSNHGAPPPAPPAIPVASAPQPKAPSASVATRRMPVTTIGGQRFAMPGERKSRAVSMRKRAMLDLAHHRAAELAGEGATDKQRSELAHAVVITHELAEFGAAYTTLDADDHAWEYWERFCKLYGWQPTFTAEYARNHVSEITQRLSIFQAWVYPQLRGRNGRADAKPRTAFNKYALAVVRILEREHVPMPKAKVIEKSLYGIMRTFKGIYGVEHLMPGRKQPMTPAIWAKVTQLPEGSKVGSRRLAWAPQTRWRDRIILRLGRVLWRTGHRLGEIVAHPSGEINFLTRSCVSIRKSNGTTISVPSVVDWRELASGDVVHLAPCASKADQFGERHCPFPSVLPHDGTDNSAAAAIRDIEIERPCPPHLRERTALFSDEDGQPFSYSVLHAEIRHVLTAVLGARAASAYSWHSFRIGLACALHAADCPDPVIQLICRWSCPESLQVYRQMGIDKNVFWTEKAQHVVFDAARVNNIPALDDLDERIQRGDFASADLQEPVVHSREPSRLVETFTIPNGTVQAYTTDANGLIGLTASIPRSFWTQADQLMSPQRSFPCKIVAECAREFLHADGSRAQTMLIEHNGQAFPIKRHDLIHNCLTRVQRASLRP